MGTGFLLGFSKEEEKTKKVSHFRYPKEKNGNRNSRLDKLRGREFRSYKKGLSTGIRKRKLYSFICRGSLSIRVRNRWLRKCFRYYSRYQRHRKPTYHTRSSSKFRKRRRYIRKYMNRH